MNNMKSFLLKSKSLAVMLIILNFLFANSASAKVTNWNGPAGGAWTTAGNWSNGLPAAGDDITIPGASTDITAVPSISLLNLTINGNCRFVPATSGNVLTITGIFTVASGVTFNAGTDNSSRLAITLASSATGTINGIVIINSTMTNSVFTNNGIVNIGSAGYIGEGATQSSDFNMSATGILRVASAAGISTTVGTGNIRVTGTRTYTAGSEVVYNGAVAQVTGNAIPTAADITINNTSGVSLSAAYTGTGILTMTAGTLDMANVNLSVGGLTGTTNITNASGAAGARTLSVTGTSSPAAYSGIISNGTASSVSLTKTGTGTLTLTGVNTYTGVTTINAGAIAVASIEDGGVAGNIGAATSAAANLVLGGGTLRFTGFTTSSNRNFTLTTGTTSTIEVVTGTESITFSGASTNTTGALTKTGAGTLILSGANLYTGTTTVTAGTLQYGANNALSTGAVNVNGGTLNMATFSDAVGAVTLTSGTISGTTGVLTGTSYTVQSGDISAILAGAVTLNKTTTGTVTLSGLNTYTGATTISAGILSVNSIQNVSGGASALGAPVTSGNGTITLSVASSVLRYTGTGHSSNRIIATTTDGSGIDASGSGALTLTGGVTSGGGSDDLVLTGTGTGIMNSIISTVGGALDKTGTGTWILGAANTWTGTTTVSAGTLEYGINSAISNGAITVSGGTLDIKTFTDAVGVVTLISGNILGTTGILTGTSYAVQSGTITAILAGAGVTLTKSTAGTVTMSGTNTFTGAKTISAGILIAANTQALGTTAASVNLNGGTLNLATDAGMSAYNVVVGASSTIVSNRATAGTGITHTLGTLSIGNFILSETVGANVNSGTAALVFGATTLSAATPRFDVATGADLTLGAVSGNFAFTKQGSGQINLNSASARTAGTVTLSAGTMVLGSVSALGTTAVPLQLDGGTLDLATDVSVNAYNTTINGTVTIASNRATSGTGITHTLGTLSLGSGDQLNVVAGSNVPAANAGLTFGATTLTAGTPLFNLSFDVNLTLGALSGNFAFTKQGNGLMTLNTASGRTGGIVTINSGSIRLGNASALGTAAVPVVLNAGSGLNLASAGSVNAHNVTVNGDASIFSNRSTSGSGITHTLGTLSIGNARLTVFYGDNVSDATAGLIFGATTLSAATPVFDVYAGGVTLTLGALTGNVAFSKDGGGRLVLNTASARTGGTVTLIDGTISLGATNGLGTTTVPLQLNGGVLDLATATTVNAYNTTIGGNVIITPNKNAAGVGITHVLGTLSTGAYTLNINQGANVTSGTAAVQFGNLTMTGAPVLSPNTANLIMAGTATGAFKLTKSGAASLQKITSAWTLDGDFEITAGTYDAGTLNTTLLGNWINNGGTHTASGASAVIFNGSSAQSIGGSSSTTFNNLTVNNSNGVSLANNETVNASVTLTNGNLVIPTGNTLTIANGNAVGGTGFGAAKSIVTQVNTGTGAKGFVRVNNMPAAAYLLPVSDGTYYLPVTLTATDVVANNSFSVCVFPGITEDGEPNGTPFSSNQKNRCVDAVWTVNYNGPGTPTAASTTMKVDWPEALEGPFFSALGDNFIGIAHYGPNWGPCQATPLSGNNTANTVSLNNITQFSPFGVGWIDPTGGVLAIKITYFNASKGNGFNTLNWQAACSSAQAIFELERSVDGINFISISNITATQARCASPFSYNDITAPAGTVFYRIKIIDVDGKASYSAIVKLSSQVKNIELSGITPNPVMNMAQVKVNTIQKDVVTLVVIAADGKVVYRNSVAVQAGSSVINMEIANLPSGVYMMKGVFENGQTNAIKFIKQ